MTYILYHGTPEPEKILEDGLRGGDNRTGGTHGVFDSPILFTSPSWEVASKYGIVIQIEIPEEIYNRGWRILDGLGDECYIFEGEGVLIDSDFLSCPELDHEDGICEEDCQFCD